MQVYSLLQPLWHSGPWWCRYGLGCWDGGLPALVLEVWWEGGRVCGLPALVLGGRVARAGVRGVLRGRVGWWVASAGVGREGFQRWC